MDTSAPTQTSWPPPPSTDFMSQAQWDVFFALIDAALPGYTSKSRAETHSYRAQDYIVLSDSDFDMRIDQATEALPSQMQSCQGAASPLRQDLVSFLEYRPAADFRVRQDCAMVLARSGQRDKLAQVLQALTTRLGCLLLTGYWTPVTSQPSEVRHSILLSWSASSFSTLRVLAKTFASLAHKSAAVASSLFHQVIGYTDTPRDWKRSESYKFHFVQVPAASDTYTLTTDVVIVGSGCGGAVAAKTLAEAGHRVLVTDKAYHFPASAFPMPQVPGLHHLFDNGGVYMTDAGASILAGSAWGGGGTVNWSVCLKPQEFVREEWAAAGLPFFKSAAFEDCLDRVWDFVGAGVEGVRHNHGNDVLLKGSAKLGFAAHEAAQNTGGKLHNCGQCHLGCGSAAKRGPAVSWLPRAAECGAEFMEGFHAEKIVFDEADGTTAVGVEGQWTARAVEGAQTGEPITKRVRILAKHVIVSAGSLWSPLLLMESGIENSQLGRNLHIHPCNLVTAHFSEDTLPWEGGIITSFNSEFENLDGNGHGVKLEPTCMVPYTCLSTLPWLGGLEAKMNFLKTRRSNSFISLTRDRDSGQVTRDARTGRPQISYSASDFDREHTLEGVQALAKICYVMGATEILPHLPGVKPFVKSTAQSCVETGDGQVKDPEFTDAAFAAWLKMVRQVGNQPPLGMWTSAHQMGTCRMGRSEEDGVVDDRGRVWGRQGLYVADASVLPSASGVNPMVTIMAIADWIARGIVEAA